MKKKTNWLRELTIILSATLCGSVAQIYIMIPAGLTSGGMPGIVRIITHYIPVEYAFVYYGCSLLVVAATWVTMGFGDVKKIIAMSISYPTIIYILEQFDIQFVGPNDKVLGAIWVGILYGLATGIGYIGGYSSGGTDSICRILKFRVFKHVPISTIILVVDGAVMVASAFVFNIKVSMLALLTVYICSEVTKMVMMGIHGTFVELHIITKDPDETIDFILHKVGRGCTSYDSCGEYTGNHFKRLECICSPRESLIIKQHLADTDPNAFVTVTQLSNIWGEHFDDITEVDNN